jgi:hypothetical protein
MNFILDAIYYDTGTMVTSSHDKVNNRMLTVSKMTMLSTVYHVRFTMTLQCYYADVIIFSGMIPWIMLS